MLQYTSTTSRIQLENSAKPVQTSIGFGSSPENFIELLISTSSLRVIKVSGEFISV